MAQVELSVESGTATILMNRPEALNALSSSVLDELDAAVERCERDDAVRGVLITGAGRSFVAGADIAEMADFGHDEGLAFVRRGQAVFDRIEGLPKPVAAAVNGFALGGGCELALACHLRFASTKARFGQPEVKLGLTPGFGGTQRLARQVGRGAAIQMIVGGGQVDATEALRIGLVNAVLEPDELLDHTRRFLDQAAANGPRAIASALAAIDRGLDVPLERGLEIEARAFADVCGTEEMREGTRAFLEKRDPSF
ncbi:MAG: enoyl-CoA hydratase/isomerase family protein [Proteobacteria bacterium]|nr:enoyl-CoA hydratase/isomerase family protein [Pseudomonadota bacterium]